MTTPASDEPGQAPLSGRAVVGAPTILVSAAALVIVVAGLRTASEIITPVFFALVLTVAVHPLQGWVRSKGGPAWLATVAAIIGVYAVLVTLTVALVWSLASFATLLPQYQDDLSDLVTQVSDQLAQYDVGAEEQATLASSFDLGRLTDVVLDVLGSLAGLSSDLFFIVTLILFLAMDASIFPRLMRQTGPSHARLADALDGFAHGTRQYLVVSSIFGLIVAVIDMGVLWACGIPGVVLWGLLAFITNYIPNIGFIIGLAPPAVLALLEGGWSLMLVVIAAYCLINFVLQSVIQPKFVGDAVGLTGTMSFLSLIFWAWVFGAMGALLAIPFTLLAKALLVDANPHAQWVRPLLSGKSSADPPTPVT
jgi:predicted PurR-regulated permease PerM